MKAEGWPFRPHADVGWYASAYSLASAALQPLSGTVYQTFSLKWAFLSFFAVFQMGALLCGVATSSHMLVSWSPVPGTGVKKQQLSDTHLVLIGSWSCHFRNGYSGYECFQDPQCPRIEI